MEKTKNPVGCPPRYKNVEDMQKLIDEYFDSCWTDKILETQDKDGNVTTQTIHYQIRPYTVMGLALALDLNSRQALINYEGKKEFVDAIKRAKAKIQMNVEEYLLNGKNAAGPIFWLKNNSDYHDKQELDVNTPIRVIINNGLDD